MEQKLTGYRNSIMRIVHDERDAALNPGQTIEAVGDVLRERSSGSKPALVRGAYQLRLAETREDREAAFRLRFLVFNLELNEGLESAYEAGYDSDEFDKTCDHLIVEHRPSQQVVGTYRLQTGWVAGSNLGYYSEREFDFSPYEPIRNSLVELGRASIHRDHRSFEVLTLLWRGIASYALQRNARYLVGCSSLSSQCPQEGSDMYWRLKEFLVEPVLRTSPRPGFTIPISAAIPEMRCINPPRLLRAYLSIGAQICGEPAMDREFKTIDFLTLLDVTKLCSSARFRFLRNE